MPSPDFVKGRQLPASYANFHIANATVLVPTLNDPQDRVARGSCRSCSPIVPLWHSWRGLSLGPGALHGLTQPHPRRQALSQVGEPANRVW